MAEPDRVRAIIDASEDMLAKGVAHIGMFQVDETFYGSGLAHQLYVALECWLEGRGSDVVRLGVLEGNPRGLSFWTRHGYRQPAFPVITPIRFSGTCGCSLLCHSRLNCTHAS